jgi:hypothetical protein
MSLSGTESLRQASRCSTLEPVCRYWLTICRIIAREARPANIQVGQQSKYIRIAEDHVNVDNARRQFRRFLRTAS